MKFTSIKFKNYRCFKDDWAGFDDVKPITVIIGRNNVGKSHLLQLVKTSCKENIIPLDNGTILRIGGIIDEKTLRLTFPDQYEGRFMFNY
jgi:predicted ATPase